MADEQTSIDFVDGVENVESISAENTGVFDEWTDFVAFVTEGVKPEWHPADYFLTEEELKEILELLESDPDNEILKAQFHRFVEFKHADVLEEVQQDTSDNEFDQNELTITSGDPFDFQNIDSFVEPVELSEPGADDSTSDIFAQMDGFNDAGVILDPEIHSFDEANPFSQDATIDDAGVILDPEIHSFDEANPFSQDATIDSDLIDHSVENEKDQGAVFTNSQLNSDEALFNQVPSNPTGGVVEPQPAPLVDRNLLSNMLNSLGKGVNSVVNMGAGIAQGGEAIAGIGATWAADKYQNYFKKTQQMNETAQEKVAAFNEMSKEEAVSHTQEAKEKRLSAYLDGFSEIVSQVKESTASLNSNVANSDMTIIELKAASRESNDPKMASFFEKQIADAVLDKGIDSIIENAESIIYGNQLIEKYLTKSLELADDLGIDINDLREGLDSYEEVIETANNTLEQVVDIVQDMETVSPEDADALKNIQDAMSASVQAFLEVLKSLFTKNEPQIGM